MCSERCTLGEQTVFVISTEKSIRVHEQDISVASINQHMRFSEDFVEKVEHFFFTSVFN